MKIIIVGAGIAGLSTYLHLRKHLSSTHKITVYESHLPRSKLPSPSTSGLNEPSSSSTPLTLDTLSESTAIVGGGLGISPNGMRVLRDLNKDLHDAVAAQGFPAENFVFKGANGWTLGVSKTSDKTVRGEGEEEEVCIASSRHGLWQTIMKSVGEDVVKYRKVVGVEREQDGKIRIKLADEEGNEEVDEADLLIGADGVKSVVRKAVFGEERFKPTYTGQSGVGGFLNTPIPPSIVNPPSMVFTFGPNGFFGYSSASPSAAQSLMWWSTFETDSIASTATIDPSAIKTALVKRHQNWRDPIVQDIIKKAEVESIYPTWVLDELPHWGENGVVLIGDAAHAMDPTTGQGASQALEDAQTLSLLLKQAWEPTTPESVFEGSEKEKLDVVLKLFYEVRNPRVQEIVERGKKIAGRKANVGVVAEYFMYFFLWLLNAVPSIGKAMLGDVNRRLYGWSASEEIRKAIQKRKTS